MKRRSTGALLAALGLVVLEGCGGSVRPSKFYTLELPPSPAAAAGVIPVTLLVGRVTAPHLLRDDRIVHRGADLQMGTYAYHRWAEPPTDMLEAMFVRLLRSSGHYRSVQALRSNARGDYILRGRIHDMEEIAAGSLVARFALETELDDLKTGTTVWSHFYSQDEPVTGRDVSSVVDALNRNAQRALAEVAAGLEQYFAKNPPK